MIFCVISLSNCENLAFEECVAIAVGDELRGLWKKDSQEQIFNDPDFRNEEICGGLFCFYLDCQRPVPARQGVFLYGAFAGFQFPGLRCPLYRNQ